MATKSRKKKKNKNQGITVFAAVVIILVACIVVLTRKEFPEIFNWADKEETNQGQQSGNADPTASPLPEGDDGLYVHFIDVGQGDCTLIISGETSMLIDAGDNLQGTKVVQYLEEMNITSLEYVIGTHPHADHIGGLDDVINNIDVKNVIIPDCTYTTKTFEDFIAAIVENECATYYAVPGDEYTLGSAKFTVISPCKEYEDSVNDWSVGIRLTYGDTAFLLCGDAEAVSEQDILDSGAEIKANVLKVSHHGSSSSSTEAFIQKVDPDIALIPCGVNNRHGHPHWETMELLEEYCEQIYRSDLNGTVVIHSDGREITVNTEKKQ